ncbi:MAG: hypothetical protein O7E56_00110 [SAR324 cluster bacterium]|nr:hypothetical protein [SAR324 cluster bacterium]
MLVVIASWAPSTALEPDRYFGAAHRAAEREFEDGVRELSICRELA